jgi:ABC-type transport system substrate-binding protein
MGSPPQPSRWRHRVGSEYCSQRFDKKVQRADATEARDPLAAIGLWQQADQIVANQSPWIPLFSSLTPGLVSRRVGDYQRNPQLGTLLYQLWVK